MWDYLKSEDKKNKIIKKIKIIVILDVNFKNKLIIDFLKIADFTIRGFVESDNKKYIKVIK